MIKDKFTLSEVAVYAGFDRPWMVDYLCRHGIVEPSGRKAPGRGRPRLFTFSDIVMLRAIHDLLKHGISVKRLVDNLKKYKKTIRSIKPNDIPFRYMVTDGINVFFVNDGDKHLAQRADFAGQYCFSFFVDLENAQKAVIRKIEEAPQVPPAKAFRGRRA
jgi:DNA-binding transcriptional MerR regulator